MSSLIIGEVYLIDTSLGLEFVDGIGVREVKVRAISPNEKYIKYENVIDNYMKWVFVGDFNSAIVDQLIGEKE